MKNKLKLAAILIAVAAVLAGGFSIYKKVTSVNTMLNKKEIKIEDETGTYEIVYAKDLKRIKMTDKKNVLVTSDQEGFYYEFTEADRKLRKLKPGETFYGVLPGNSGEIVTAVVEDIQVDEDRVIIRGSQPAMSQLFDKVAINAEFAADALVIDELAEGVELEETSLTQSEFEGLPEDGLQTGSLDGRTNAGVQDRSLGGLWKNPFSKNKTPKKLPVDHTFRKLIRIEEGAIDVEAYMGITIEKVTVAVNFDGGDSPVYSTVAVRTTSEMEGEIMAAGNYLYDESVGTFHIPTSLPFVTVPVGLNAYFSISGGVGGSFTWRQTSVNGTELAASMDGVSAEEIHEDIRKETDYHFTKFEAEMRTGPKVAVGVAFAKKLLKVDISALVGVKVEAEYAPFEPWDEFADSCHDCDICFEGETSLFAELGFNIEVKQLKKGQGQPLRASWVFAEWLVPINEFYLSLGPDGKWDPRFGQGKCPYRRYRTVIKVYNEIGEISDAEVSAAYPDGRFDSTRTDEYGFAVMWLPDGENTLYAEYNGYINDNHYTVKGAPGKTEIALDFEQNIYVICNFLEDHDRWEGSLYTTEACQVKAEEFPELYGVLKSHYPQAQFFSAVDVGTPLSEGKGIREFFKLIDITLRPGDVIVYIGASYNVDGDKTDGLWFDADFYDYVGGDVYLCLDNGLLDMLDGYYSLGWEKDESEGIPDEEHPGWDKGFYSYITEVYFYADEEVRDFVEYDEQFNHIFDGYYYEGQYHGHNTYKEERTLNDEVYYITGIDWEHNPTGYLQSQLGSWGEALVEFALKCFTERIDALLVE